MPDLVIHSRPVATLFDLLGHDENNMTAALGWGLAHSSAFLQGFVDRVASGVTVTERVVIELQSHDRDGGGLTDVELKAPGQLHIIVEAKRVLTIVPGSINLLPLNIEPWESYFNAKVQAPRG